MNGPMVQCVYGGKSYTIPDIWLMGYCTGNRATVQEAVAWWAYQESLATDPQSEIGSSARDLHDEAIAKGQALKARLEARRGTTRDANR